MRKYFVILSICLFVYQYSYAQTSSLNVIIDPRSIATGESSVANIYCLAPSQNNPAALINTKGFSIFYADRTINWASSLDKASFYSADFNIATSIGYFSFSYNRFNLGEGVINTPSNPVGAGKADFYDHTITISYANHIIKNLAFGLNLKTFNRVMDNVSGINYSIEHNTPLLADFGLLYNLKGFIKNYFVLDKISIGITIKNFGTVYREDSKLNTVEEKYSTNLPRYLSVGFAYELNVPLNSNKNIFRFLFTGEYKNYLNPDKYEESNTDYWGTGFEASFYNMLFLRMGGTSYPYTSIYGNKGNLSMRYGAGLAIPLSQVHLNVPVTLSFDYAFIPINYVIFSAYFTNNKKNLHSMSFQINYFFE